MARIDAWNLWSLQAPPRTVVTPSTACCNPPGPS